MFTWHWLVYFWCASGLWHKKAAAVCLVYVLIDPLCKGAPPFSKSYEGHWAVCSAATCHLTTPWQIPIKWQLPVTRFSLAQLLYNDRLSLCVKGAVPLETARGQCCSRNGGAHRGQDWCENPAGELRRSDIFLDVAQKAVSSHIISQCAPHRGAHITHPMWLGGEGSPSMADKMNKSADPGSKQRRKMTWPFCLSRPFCHHYAWLFRA